MKLAINQPYFFPYIGYFQLIDSVNKFVVGDDVSFIRHGWINRNRVLLDGRIHQFSVPLVEASSHRMIKDTFIHREKYGVFKVKFSKTIRHAYSKAPYFRVVDGLVQHVLNSECESIGRLAVNSLKSVCSYLGIDTQFVPSSAVYKNAHLQVQSRVLDICRREGADTYINLPGGIELYQERAFAASGIDLLFIRPNPKRYGQAPGDSRFVPWLSIIDVLMFNSREAVRSMLDQTEFARPGGHIFDNSSQLSGCADREPDGDTVGWHRTVSAG